MYIKQEEKNVNDERHTQSFFFALFFFKTFVMEKNIKMIVSKKWNSGLYEQNNFVAQKLKNFEKYIFFYYNESYDFDDE